ncbi:MAG: hypothetical protein A2075_16600 [Geobacteraceae bacterium GWC2_58_44]|nr:MAG: hypothetical protein A2075_16600 [Geobacteraceae bacterium GWC2_58_44]HBG05050.1 hypothetical protein [Geobacter sp.]
MKQLIINADDFGYNSERDEAIKKLLTDRLLTSATILVNQKNTESAVSYVREKNLRCCGLHLNLADGYFTTDPSKELRYVVNYKKFSARFLLENYFAYLKEISNQVRIAVDSFPVSHLDGHYHIHSFPLFWFPIIHTMKRYRLSKIRNAYTYYEPDSPVKAATKLTYRRLLSAASINFPQYFFDVKYFMKNIRKVNALPDGTTIEVMCHPDAGGNEDYRLMMSVEYRDALRNFNLISYDDLT